MSRFSEFLDKYAPIHEKGAYERHMKNMEDKRDNLVKTKNDKDIYEHDKQYAKDVGYHDPEGYAKAAAGKDKHPWGKMTDVHKAYSKDNTNGYGNIDPKDMRGMYHNIRQNWKSEHGDKGEDKLANKKPGTVKESTFNFI